MPNCDFYGSTGDHAQLLTWLFNEGACEVYELSSDFGQPLTRFYSSAEVVAQFDRRYDDGKKWKKVYLQLYVIGAGPTFVPRRVSLDPKACNGATYRYAAEGWGLVQLYLGNLNENSELESSHTNHFTRAGAEAWATVATGKAEPEAWDFTRITSFSSRLNREIRKRSVGKVGSMVVLPEAHELWQSGVPLLR